MLDEVGGRQGPGRDQEPRAGADAAGDPVVLRDQRAADRDIVAGERDPVADRDAEAGKQGRIGQGAGLVSGGWAAGTWAMRAWSWCSTQPLWGRSSGGGGRGMRASKAGTPWAILAGR